MCSRECRQIEYSSARPSNVRHSPAKAGIQNPELSRNDQATEMPGFLPSIEYGVTFFRRNHVII